MSYLRVIPRDLFNEANLLKCYGQVYLELEKLGYEEQLISDDISDPRFSKFDVQQNPHDGSLTINNIWLSIKRQNWPYRLHFKRPLNSRRPWPLYLVFEDDDIAVFNEDGTFTDEMKTFVLGGTQ